ncbi:hypothetical protein BC940DRAFT_286843 [Gongronella butleri]|nr:hypothetical protein BC940DRAFT_286843 [Gongronella butleri]
MSFETFPASLPFIASLHDQAQLDADIDVLSAKVTQGTMKSQSKQVQKVETQAFMAALEQISNLTLTENGAVALSTTGHPCVDLYATMTTGKADTDMLEAAYRHDALTTLKLLFHCRSIHSGKRNKFTFYSGFFWLLKHHPKTALKNLEVLVKGTIPNRPVTDDDALEADGWDNLMDIDAPEKQDTPKKTLHYMSHGYWKDLLHLLSAYCLREAFEDRYSCMNHPRQIKDKLVRNARNRRRRRNRLQRQKMARRYGITGDNYAHDVEEQVKNNEAKEVAKWERYSKRQDRRDRVVQLLEKDLLYRCLHMTVARLFADQLEKDLIIAKEEKLRKSSAITLANKLSFAAKWAPSLASAHDKYSLIATSIAERLFIKDVQLAKDASRRAHRLNDARELYRRRVISPLRKFLDVPERKMSQGQWNKIDFGRVPAISHMRNAEHFIKYAKPEYTDFMLKVQQGRAKVAGATLGPHEFVERVFNLGGKNVDLDRMLINGQWSSYISALKDAAGPDNLLHNSLAVCDVSGSMKYTEDPKIIPLHAAIGLSLTLMNLAAPPFNGKFITFSKDPRVVSVDVTQPFSQQVRDVRKSPIGYSTDLFAVFVRLLLPMAVKHKLKQEDMVKRLFVFTDMQFDDNRKCGKYADEFNTLWDDVIKAYSVYGYEPPEVVWWNLAVRKTTFAAQAAHDTPGMATIAGCSPNMFKTFMQGNDMASTGDKSQKDNKQEPADQMTPEQVMNKDLSNVSFSELRVYD